MFDSLIARYGGLPVPRYTSYPTAAEFSSAIGSRDYARWLGRVDAKESASAYVHVPFCRDLCHYCGCHTKVVRRDEVILSYGDSLVAEISLVAGQLPSGLKLSRLHWGGGTPSILGTDGIATVIGAIRRHFSFEDEHEHAMELDPRYVDLEFARALVDLGINRVSLGVQDLDPEVQRAIGRIQPQSVIGAAVDALRAAGLTRINFDLMYGLPLQTEVSIRRTCEAVAGLKPERIACYGYAHMPARKRHQRLIDPSTLPDVGARFLQAQAAAEVLTAHGYAKIGIDHFALPHDPLASAACEGRLYRNFQGYTDDDRPNLFGFGASAISRTTDGFAQNIADVGSYQRAMSEGRIPTTRGYRLSDRDRLRGQIIEHLMCNFKVDLGLFGGADEFADELALLRPLVVDGVVTTEGHVVALTGAGRPFVRLVAAVFDQFREEEPIRFSQAI